MERWGIYMIQWRKKKGAGVLVLVLQRIKALSCQNTALSALLLHDKFKLLHWFGLWGQLPFNGKAITAFTLNIRGSQHSFMRGLDLSACNRFLFFCCCFFFGAMCLMRCVVLTWHSPMRCRVGAQTASWALLPSISAKAVKALMFWMGVKAWCPAVWGVMFGCPHIFDHKVKIWCSYFVVNIYSKARLALQHCLKAHLCVYHNYSLCFKYLPSLSDTQSGLNKHIRLPRTNCGLWWKTRYGSHFNSFQHVQICHLLSSIQWCHIIVKAQIKFWVRQLDFSFWPEDCQT